MAIQLPSPLDKFVNADGTLTANAIRFLRTIVAATDSPVIPQYLDGSHAERLNGYLATSYPDGSVYFETDRTLYYVATAGVWQYLAGICRVQQDALPADLGTSGDVDVLAYVTDFAHMLRWNGSAWEWAPGEDGSDYVVAFVTGPDETTGWHACDGSANVVRLLPTGERAFATVPNTPGSWYRV